jgi:hypothetical protein
VAAAIAVADGLGVWVGPLVGVADGVSVNVGMGVSDGGVVPVGVAVSAMATIIGVEVAAVPSRLRKLTMTPNSPARTSKTAAITGMGLNGRFPVSLLEGTAALEPPEVIGVDGGR